MKSLFAWLLACIFLQSCVYHVHTGPPPKNGKAIHYYGNTKKIESTGKYSNSTKIGEWKFYRTDGTLHSVQNFAYNVLHGKSTSYYPDEKVRVTGSYYLGKSIGEWFYYYPNGKPEIRQQFKDTEEDALVEYRFNEKTGHQQYEINYARGNKHGAYKEWYADKPEQVLLEGNYKMNQKDGVWKSWNKNGTLIYQEYYSYGAKEGLQSYYYENGKPKQAQVFANDRLNGLTQEWYANGTLMFSGYYVDGKQDSLHAFWDEAGNKLSETFYKAGKKHGAEKVYNNKGILIKQLNYVNDNQDGLQKIWNDKGELWAEEVYENSMKIREMTYYPNGKIATENIFKNGILKAAYSYTKNGKKTKNPLVQIPEVEEYILQNEEEAVLPVDIYEPEDQSKKEIFMVAEQMAEFPGGEAAMYKFLNDNLVYPKIAKENNVQGKVIVQFTVKKDGSLTDFSVVKGIGHGCDEEALRLIKSMPKWQTGKQNGMPVDVKYRLPVKFVLK